MPLLPDVSVGDIFSIDPAAVTWLEISHQMFDSKERKGDCRNCVDGTT